MGNCLVTKLKSVVDNNELAKINEVKMFGEVRDTEAAATLINIIADGAGNNADLRFIDCYFNSAYSPGATTGESSISAHNVNGYVTPGTNCKIFLSPKDNIRILDVAIEMPYVDIVEELKYSGNKLRELRVRAVKPFTISKLASYYPSLIAFSNNQRGNVEGSFNDFSVNMTSIDISHCAKVEGSLDRALDMPNISTLILLFTPNLYKKRSTITALRNRGVQVYVTDSEIDEDN